jgi:hypothetical protein
MKRLLLSAGIAIAMVACKQETGNPESVAAIQTTTVTESAPAKEGSGKVTLQCGSQTLTVEGKCGGVTTTGEMIVAVQDKDIPAKVFTISFNTANYPESGKTYTIKKSDYMSEDKKPDNEIYVAFSQITEKMQADWSSNDVSGTLQFTANGNEIKCKFSGIKLQPSEMYNKGELNNVGTASGEMTFYKN